MSYIPPYSPWGYPHYPPRPKVGHPYPWVRPLGYWPYPPREPYGYPYIPPHPYPWGGVVPPWPAVPADPWYPYYPYSGRHYENGTTTDTKYPGKYSSTNQAEDEVETNDDD